VFRVRHYGSDRYHGEQVVEIRESLGLQALTPIWGSVAPGLTELPPAIRAGLVDEWYDHIQPQFGAAPRWQDHRKALRDLTITLKRSKLDIGFDAPEIAIRAEKMAAAARRERTLPLIERLAKSVQLTLPLGNSQSTDESIAARCYEPKTWRKSMEKNYTRRAENHLRAIGFIERGGMLYCSDLALSWYRGKMRAQEAYLKSRMVQSDTGEQLELWDVAQKSLSNKSNRRSELMTRMRGFEDDAKKSGDVATFFTLTTPSAFHARAVGRGHNELFSGATVREAQAWLSKIWARARAALAKKGITIYGFRVAEPHHDGTPHWHLVLFCAPNHRNTLCELLREYWLSEYADEPGALVHRTAVKFIDEHKGTATGYLSKYIAKNIDGFGLEGEVSDENAQTPISDAALRVTAWAAIHGIRQFAQIGGPSVGVYRQCRRVRHPTDLKTIEPIRAAADRGDFAAYIALQGGVSCGRLAHVRNWTERTGELNSYGEPKAAEIVGIMSVSEALQTRTKQWRIVRKTGAHFADSAIGEAGPDGLCKNRKSGAIGSGLSSQSDLGPVSITVAGAVSLSDPHGWTNPNETSMYGPH
jgi:Bacteriophage replication gene A protein (GPA)